MISQGDCTLCMTTCKCAKEVVSDKKVTFLGEFKLQSIKLVTNFFRAVKMTVKVHVHTVKVHVHVHTSYSKKRKASCKTDFLCTLLVNVEKAMGEEES